MYRTDLKNLFLMPGWHFCLLILGTLFQGCALYYPKPLDDQAVSNALASPNMTSIRIMAKEIKHPILKTRDIDFKQGISDQDAAIIAVIANPSLRAERDRKGIVESQLLQAGILPNPTFSYSLGIPTGGDTQGTVTAYGLGLDWDIVKPLLTRGAKVDAARAHNVSVNLDIAWKEWQTANSARLHVYKILSLEKKLRVALRDEKGLSQSADVMKKAVDLGDMTVVDLDAVDAALRRTHANVLDIEQKLDQERFALNTVLGFPPSSSIILREDVDFSKFKASPALDDIMAGIETRRLDLLALKEGYQSQEASLRAAVRAQFPSIGIGLSHARDTTNVITTGFSVSISLPLFDRNQGNIAAEKASRQQLYDEYMDRVFQARADAAGILADIEAVKKQMDAANKSLEALEKLVHISYNGFLERNIDAISYYNEVERLASKRLDVLTLEQNLADLHVALEIAAGEYIWNQ